LQTCNALLRASLTLCLALFSAAVLANVANADDGTSAPRAVPAARSMPRTFSSYDDLIKYATTIAADQGALDQQLGDAQAQLLAQLGVESERLALVMKAAGLSRTEQELAAAGALSAPRTPSWQMPTIGEVTQPFGPTPLGVEPARVYQGTSYPHFHDGVDIAGEWAADIVAPARGRVVFVGAMMDGAEVVVIAHDGGLVSMYAHLDNWAHPPTVAAGDEVAAGQKIGTVGMTGIVTGAHLHWAVWRNGELIDPLSLLSS